MDGIFRLRFEHVGGDGNTTRSEQIYESGERFVADGAEQVGKNAAELFGKVIGSMKEDGIIPPPSNVVRVDFIKKRRAA